MSEDAALREQNIEIVREYIETINSWNFERMEELLDDEAVMEMPFAPSPMAREMRGKATIMEFVKTVPALIDAENLHDLESHAFADDPGEIVSTYKSDMEIKPKMTPYKNRYIARWTVRDGKVTYFAEYYDGIELLKALGGTVSEAQFGE